MRLKCIALANAVSGMVLGKPVHDSQGRTLCKEGTALTEKLILRFEQMSITTVFIESDEVLTAKDLAAMHATLDKRFAAVRNDPLLSELKSIMEKKLKELEQG